MRALRDCGKITAEHLSSRNVPPGSLAVMAQYKLSAGMKVLLFVRDLGVGGTQRQLAVLAAGLARRGHDVAVVVLYAGGALEGLLAGSGARLLAVGKTARWAALGPL